MALIKCDECKKEVSDKAITCPHCGAPVIVPTAVAKSGGTKRALQWIVGIVLVLLLIRACAGSTNSTPASGSSTAIKSAAPATPASQPPSAATLKAWITDVESDAAPAPRREAYANSIIEHFPESPEAAKAKKLLPTITKLAIEEKGNAPWYYSNNEDPMSGLRVGYASIMSTNTLSLDFPYRGEQRGTLAIRRHPKNGNDVIVWIEKGQVLCSSYNCDIKIRFDDGQPVNYTGNEPADNSTETVFLPYSVAKRIQAAKRVRIELNLYQNGQQILDFNVKGFKPERMSVIN